MKCNFDSIKNRKVKVVVENCPLPTTSGVYYNAQKATCSFELNDSGSAEIHFTGNMKPEDFGGYRGAIKRSNQAKAILDDAQMTPGSMR